MNELQSKLVNCILEDARERNIHSITIKAPEYMMKYLEGMDISRVNQFLEIVKEFPKSLLRDRIIEAYSNPVEDDIMNLTIRLDENGNVADSYITESKKDDGDPIRSVARIISHLYKIRYATSTHVNETWGKHIKEEHRPALENILEMKDDKDFISFLIAQLNNMIHNKAITFYEQDMKRHPQLLKPGYSKLPKNIHPAWTLDRLRFDSIENLLDDLGLKGDTMKIEKMLTEAQAENQRTFYEAVRSGMDYDEAIDKIIEPFFDEECSQAWESYKKHGALTESSTSKQNTRLYELDEENLTITEVIE